MRFRQKLVRAVNKLRGVDARELGRMHRKANVMYATLALHLGVSLPTVYDWEAEYVPIPKELYERAMRFLRERADHAECGMKITAQFIDEIES